MAEWPLIAVRFGLYLTLAVLFGLSAFGLYGLRACDRGHALALSGWLTASATIALLLSVGWLVLVASSMADVPPWPIDRDAIDALLTDSAIGTAWKIRLVALALAGLAALRPSWRGAVVACSAIALSTLAWTGHGTVDEGMIGWLHLGADIVHLIASGAWVGALIGLVALVTRPLAGLDSDDLALTHRALHGFGAIGLIVVATLVATGLVNSWLLIGVANVSTLMTTLYGQLLIAKLLLFTAMIALAGLNRLRLTPAFERALAADDPAAAVRALRLSLVIETGCVVTILALVAWLGTLASPGAG